MPASQSAEGMIVRLPSLLVASIAPLVLGFVLLLLGFVVYYLQIPSVSSTPTVRWSGASLKLTKGSGRTEVDSFIVDALSRTGTAILRLDDKEIDTDRYPFLSFQTDGLWAGTEFLFFWMTREEHGKTFSAPLRWSGDGIATMYLGNLPDWQGAAVKFGIGIKGELREQVTIGQIALHPFSVGNVLETVWTDWTAFEGWHQYSLHFIVGGPRNPIVHPVPAVAVWVGLSVLLYVGWTWARLRHWDWRVVGAIFLVGWLILDARWQLELFRQLQETIHRFEGRGWEEKQLAAEDGILFKQMNIIQKYLPNRSERIFLVTGNFRDRDEYKRLRARYHLLPHNAYPLVTFPPKPKLTRDGDYILMLGANPAVQFNSDLGRLEWDGENVLQVRPIVKAGDAVLFKVDSTAAVKNYVTTPETQRLPSD